MNATKSSHFTNPERFEQIAAAALELSSPRDVSLMQRLVEEYIAKAPAGDVEEPHANVARHFAFVFPAIMGDPRTKPVLARLEQAHSDRPSKIAKPVFAGEAPDAPDFPTPRVPWGPIALGSAGAAIAGNYVLEAIAPHFLDDQP